VILPGSRGHLRKGVLSQGSSSPAAPLKAAHGAKSSASSSATSAANSSGSSPPPSHNQAPLDSHRSISLLRIGNFMITYLANCLVFGPCVIWS
jgi:hypothetical protein